MDNDIKEKTYKDYVFDYLQQLHILYPYNRSFIQGQAAIDIILDKDESTSRYSIVSEILPEYMQNKLSRRSDEKSVDYDMWNIEIANNYFISLFCFSTYMYNEYPYVSLFKTNLDSIVIDKNGRYMDVFDNIKPFLERKIIYINGELTKDDIMYISMLVNYYNFTIDLNTFPSNEKEKLKKI